MVPGVFYRAVRCECEGDLWTQRRYPDLSALFTCSECGSEVRITFECEEDRYLQMLPIPSLL